LTEGLLSTEPPMLLNNVPGTGWFTVSSGPCAVSDGGRCVGRAGGYLSSEACAITVGGGGMLGACGVFDTDSYYPGHPGLPGDAITMPDGSTHYGSECPVGALLLPGDSVGWASDEIWQGSVGNWDNGCAANGMCGLPYSSRGLGGGWQICFA
jgi:hypothetical protein